MKTFSITVTWQHKGTGYTRQDANVVKAGNLKAAVSQVLNGEFKKKRTAWREPAGAYFTVKATCLGPEIHIPEGKE